MFDCHNPNEIKQIFKLGVDQNHLREHRFKHSFEDFLNPLHANRTKWSNTLKQFVDEYSQGVVWVCLTILCGWHLKVYPICSCGYETETITH